ncbi:MAPK-activated protein kinase Srk1 [Blastocladiella emersonii ATCC 22665]|nr:MAPK-activated protein kinase Srk1 [Blastocladiella emersonii ATCC 22665]
MASDPIPGTRAPVRLELEHDDADFADPDADDGDDRSMGHEHEQHHLSQHPQQQPHAPFGAYVLLQPGQPIPFAVLEGEPARHHHHHHHAHHHNPGYDAAAAGYAAPGGAHGGGGISFMDPPSSPEPGDPGPVMMRASAAAAVADPHQQPTSIMASDHLRHAAARHRGGGARFADDVPAADASPASRRPGDVHVAFAEGTRAGDDDEDGRYADRMDLVDSFARLSTPDVAAAGSALAPAAEPHEVDQGGGAGERHARQRRPTGMAISIPGTLAAEARDLEGFRLVKKMGEGAFSKVYHAIDVATADHVAIKAVAKTSLSPNQRNAILKEVSVHARLHHPNIIKLRHHFETHKHYVFVLELAPGGELFQRIVELTYFSEDLSRHVIVQVARAIEYLHHAVGVVHRDIKPENLLFTHIPFPTRGAMVPTGRTPGEEKMDEGPFTPGLGGGGVGVVKLGDFGLSKVIGRDGTKTPCGTVGYTAPEIVTSQSYTASVDLWATGCVLYTMLCGFPPFHDEDQSILTQKVARGEWTFLAPWWDRISPEAKDLVAKLLEVRPDKRYTIDQFFTHPWVNQTSMPARPLWDPQLPTSTAAFGAPTTATVGFRDHVEVHEPAAAAASASDYDAEPPQDDSAGGGGWGNFHIPLLKTPATERGPAATGYDPFGAPVTEAEQPAAATATTPSAKTPSQRNFKHYFDLSYRAVNDMLDSAAPAEAAADAGPDAGQTWSMLGVIPRFAPAAASASSTSGSGTGAGTGSRTSRVGRALSRMVRGTVGSVAKSSGSGSSSGTGTSPPSSTATTGWPASGGTASAVPASASSLRHAMAMASPPVSPTVGTFAAASSAGSSAVSSPLSTAPSSPARGASGGGGGGGFALDLKESSLLSKRRTPKAGAGAAAGSAAAGAASGGKTARFEE